LPVLAVACASMPVSSESAESEPERFYITTPIYYVNDVPHVGHAYTTVTADALARWHRLLGHNTFFLTGTDEHGLKIERAATERGVTPQEHADRTSARFRETWDLLDIAYDDYIRTTEPRHHAAVQKLLQQIYDNGHIFRKTYSGLYCVGCEAYYTPDELDAEGRCLTHGTVAELLEEDNWFFRLSAFEQPLLDWYERCPDAVAPSSKRNEALGLIRGGLQDVSISRQSLTWGVPVPWDPEQVFYVWYDALTNYITAIGYGTDEQRFRNWWPSVHHILGKDILRFHCVYWPAMLLAAGLEPPHQLNVHGYLLLGGEKMSKSKLNQVFPADLVETFGVDGFRYHFLRDQTFGPDGDFSFEGMVVRYNTDLANNLGNLLSRVSTVVAKKCGGVGPSPSPSSPLAAVAAQVVADTTTAWAATAPSKALDATWELIREANAYLETHEPWKMEPGPDLDAVMGDSLEVLRIVAILASPALTRASDAVWSRIGLAGRASEQHVPADVAWGQYPGGLPVEKGAPLFPRIPVEAPVTASGS